MLLCATYIGHALKYLRHTAYIDISVSVAVECWLERKFVFVDIVENCLEYERVLKFLNYHQAHIETFLSKKVTHIITAEKSSSKNEIIAKKMQYNLVCLSQYL